MRVLWVEDFGDGGDYEALLKEVFKDIPQPHRSALAEYVDSIDSRQQDYGKWRKWYRDQPWLEALEIDICCSDAEFEALTGQSATDHYDAVLLDVNLENDFFQLSRPYNSREGGFWLYNKLIAQSGFPPGRIALLTAHTGEEHVKKFQEDCFRNNHEPLKGLPKSSNSAAKWVEELSCSNDHFLLLRRGFLDGATFVGELLNDPEKKDAAIHFNRFLGVKKASDNEVKSHLNKIKDAMPDRLQEKEAVGERLRNFRGALGELWERASPGNYQGSDEYIQQLGWVMKSLRNWSTHQAPLDDCGTAHMAFLVMAYFRTSFQMGDGMRDDELRPYEHHLVRAMGNPGLINHEAASQFLNERYRRARSLLDQVVREGQRSRMSRDNDPIFLKGEVRNFGQIANELELAERRPEGFSFADALGLMFANSIQCTRKAREFRNEWGTLPAWVKAVLERLLNPAQ